MILERAEHPLYTSNAYLLADEASGRAVLVDGHGEARALLDRAEADGLEVERILLTHHHGDHADVAEYLERFDVPVLAHPRTAEQLGDLVTGTLEDGDEVAMGDVVIRALYTPGHAPGHLALLAGEGDVLTGDVLFKGTVGGTRAPGATGYEDLRRSVMERLMALDHAIRVHPGHTLPSTIGAEWEHNPFIRLWRGLEEEGDAPCTVAGQPATLVLWAPDYDGTNKAWVRFADGTDAIVGGSQVERGGAAS